MILVGGEFTTINGQPAPYLARLHPDGTLDTSANFAVNGPIWRLAVQPDSKIIVAGNFSMLQEVERHGVARLQTNGLIDLSFDANATVEFGEGVFAIGIRPNGKILGATGPTFAGFRVFQLLSDGQQDSEFTSTNMFDNYVFSFAVGTSGKTLVGGKFTSINDVQRHGLALLDSNGVHVASFDAQLERYSSIFSLANSTNGLILVGGSFSHPWTSLIPLARMTSEYEWDPSFAADSFAANFMPGNITMILTQPDNSILVGGKFFQVGGYWRRHVARLNSQGQVDPCFNSGLGLGGFEGVRTLALQTDGRVLVGGQFQGVDAVDQPQNFARIMGQDECGPTRVYLITSEGNSGFTLGIFPPGVTNHLQLSTNLVDWKTVDTQTNYCVYWPFVFTDHSNAFFRIKKEY